MNDFRQWMKAMGYHGKEVSKAAALIGLKSRTAKAISSGARDESDTERLAMSAVLAGLPPWSPETAREVHAIRGLVNLIRTVQGP